MPNRIIKESIKRSPEIDRLNWFEEVVFYRLIVTADDYGRLDGRTVVLKNDLFPTKETVTKKAVEDALSKLTSVGLLVPYVDAASGMSYYYLPTWKEHQRIRDSKARYPEPPDENGLAATRGNSPQLAATRGENPLARAESESNPNPNPNQNPNHDARADADPLVMYAVNNLQTMSPGNLHDLAGFAEDLPADVIRFAIDEGCANGAPRWSYVSAILRGYLRDGIRTVGDAKAAKAKRKTQLDRKPQDNPALNFEQREYKDEDFGDDFFIDLDKYGEGT